MPELDSPKIKHRPLIPFDRGTLKKDAVTFYVNNKIYNGFQNVTITKSLMKLTGTFQIVMIDKLSVDAEDFQILPGDRIHCHLGKHALFEGYVDGLNITLTAGSRNITISGRDRTADLFDCSHVGATDFNKLDFTSIAKELVKPFGLKVIVGDGVDIGAIFEKFTVKIGETVFEALNRAAKERELILLTTTHGNLLVDKRANKRAPSELVEGVNILQVSASFDNSDRFSSYKVKGQQPGVLGSASDTNASKGEATDEAITRYRPNVIIAESSVNNDSAQKRANYEASVRTAKGLKVNVTVKDWTQKDGTIWQVNELMQVRSPSVGIKSQMLVSNVKFKKDNNGRTTEIELIRKDSLEFKSKKKKSGDILTRLGIN